MNYTNEDVQNAIKSGLKDYKEFVKSIYRKDPFLWESLSLKEKADVARGLVYMERVAKNPELFFAKRYTFNDWKKRALKCAAEYKISKNNAFYAVKGPKENVKHNVQNVLHGSIAGWFYKKYGDFLKMIQDYEYADCKWAKDIAAEEIMQESQRIADRLTIKKTDCLRTPFVFAKLVLQSFRQNSK